MGVVRRALHRPYSRVVHWRRGGSAGRYLSLYRGAVESWRGCCCGDGGRVGVGCWERDRGCCGLGVLCDLVEEGEFEVMTPLVRVFFYSLCWTHDHLCVDFRTRLDILLKMGSYLIVSRSSFPT